jgi:uncharacterized membrane protein YuzA (DUF378 family)
MSDRKRFFTLETRGVFLWAATLALLVTTVLSVEWWHPYCDAQADGPGFYAWGFPLPYAAPTGVSSGEFTYMPHVLALDLALVGIVSFALLRWIFARGTPRSRALGGIGSIATGFVLFLLLAAFQGADSYWSYRPSALALRAGHRACDR